MGIPRLRADGGPAILSYGFRPFFLLGALYAGLSILFWLPAYAGYIETWSAFAPVDWHMHEMLFGFLPAIVTGFLLTAIPNWTGRLPVQGRPLLALVILWFLGRFAVFASAAIGWEAAAIMDSLFLAVVAGAAAIEIVAGRNWRNLKVLLPLAVLLGANVLFHVEAQLQGASDISRRLGLAAAITLIMVMGGRLIPSFTRNWLVRENQGRLPVPFGRFDAGVILVSVAAFAVWTALPDHSVSAAALALSGALNLWRLGRWAGDRTTGDPLVLILHVAYAFIPLGLLLLALSIWFPTQVSTAAGIHALGGGAIGAMTLAVMVRATLGHTGQALHAGKGALFIFTAVVTGAVARILAALAGNDMILMDIAGLAWAAAFLGFASVYGKALVTARKR